MSNVLRDLRRRFLSQTTAATELPSFPGEQGLDPVTGQCSTLRRDSRKTLRLNMASKDVRKTLRAHFYGNLKQLNAMVQKNNIASRKTRVILALALYS